MNIQDTIIQQEDMEYEFFKVMEEDWKESLPRFSDTELLDIFPEAVVDFPAKIRELAHERKRKMKEIRCELSRMRNIKDEVHALIAEVCIKFFLVAELIGIERSKFFFERLLPRKHSPKTRRSYSSEDIERAKSRDILEITGSHIEGVRRKGKSYAACCPFHHERIPSFFLYQDSNSYHCFGCGAHGDVISFVQKMMHLPFSKALKFLLSK